VEKLEGCAENRSGYHYHLELVHSESWVDYPPVPYPVGAFHQNQPFAEQCQDSRVRIDLEEMA